MEFYTTLAKYYDRIYHYVDYGQQALFFARLFDRYAENASKSLVDFACGTGSHLNDLRSNGFKATGVDLSEPILEEARRKCAQARFVQGDMIDIDLKQTYGMVLCFFNAVLYAQPKHVLEKTIINFGKHLKKGGIAIFDIVDKSVGLSDKGKEFRYEDGPTTIVFFPRWHYPGEGEILNLYVEFDIKDGGRHIVAKDHHKMCAVSIPEVCEFVSASGMTPICLARKFDEIRDWDGIAKSAIIVAKKHR